jgi:hypothetical protein
MAAPYTILLGTGRGAIKGSSPPRIVILNLFQDPFLGLFRPRRIGANLLVGGSPANTELSA